jgi:hypothetical protein
VIPFTRRDGRSGFFAEGERRRTAARVLFIERRQGALHFRREALLQVENRPLTKLLQQTLRQLTSQA